MRRRVLAYLRSNVLGLVAIFIALTAGAYAAGLARNSVKSTHIATNAVKPRHIGADAVRAKHIRDGNVRAAELGASAVSGAKIRNGSVDMADLDSETTAELRDRCPSGMTKIANTLCFEAIASGPGTWSSALADCTARNLRMPSVDEAYLVYTKNVLATGTLYWTNAVGGNAGAPISHAVYLNGTGGGAATFNISEGQPNHFCVTTPGDG